MQMEGLDDAKSSRLRFLLRSIWDFSQPWNSERSIFFDSKSVFLLLERLVDLSSPGRNWFEEKRVPPAKLRNVVIRTFGIYPGSGGSFSSGSDFRWSFRLRRADSSFFNWRASFFSFFSFLVWHRLKIRTKIKQKHRLTSRLRIFLRWYLIFYF